MPTRLTTAVRADGPDPEELYRHNIKEVLDDAPDYRPEFAKYAAYRPYPNDTWEAFVARIDAQLNEATIAADPFQARFGEDGLEPPPVMHLNDEEPAIQLLQEGFRIAADHFSSAGDDDLMAAVAVPLARNAASLGLLPKRVTPSSAEWAWARARCALACTGYRNHAAVCKALASEPEFPWSLDETNEQWVAGYTAAHRDCGWPVGLCLFPLELLRRLPPLNDEAPVPQWLLWIYLFRVLLHTRVVPGGIRVTRNGKIYQAECSRQSNIIGHQRPVVALFRQAFETRGNGFLEKALSIVLNGLVYQDLRSAEPIGSLPPTVIAGPWSRVEHWRGDEWSQVHARVTGVWHLDATGRIVEGLIDPQWVLDYIWPTDAPSSASDHACNEARLSVPPQAVPARPSELFGPIFPNLVGSPADMALLDAVILADFLRPDIPELAIEYPIVCILPETPTLVESVNQGKTTLAFQLARVLSPGLPSPIAFRDSSSAPDQRTVSEDIRHYGTICLDEFAMPRSPSHTLSRGNLASLATGGAVAAGRVYENIGASLKLRHPLVISAKALELTEDLITRSVFFYVRQLTDAERNRPEVWRLLSTAKLAYAVRFNAVAFLSSTGFRDTIKTKIASAVSGRWRFGVHRLIAAELIGSAEAVDTALANQRKRFLEHYRIADEQGVITSLREARDTRITLEQFFADLSAFDLQTMADACRRSGGVAGTDSSFWRASVASLWKARCALLNGMTPGQAMQVLTSLGYRISDRTAVTALTTEIATRIEPNAALRVPGPAGQSGWFVFRHPGMPCSIALLHLPEHAQHDTLTADG